MEIRIKCRSYNQILVWVLFFGPFLMAPFIQFFQLPESIKYLLDVSWVSLLLAMITKRKKNLDRTVKILMHGVLYFFLFTLINYLVNFQSLFYYLWGFRNNFRGFALFFGVIYYFSEDDVKQAINWFNSIFYINAFLVLFQFFVLGYKQDYLGGIFGVQSGCNGYLNLFLCIALSISFIKYIENQKSIKTFVAEIILMLILAAMAELKFFYVEFVILIGVGMLCSRFSWKKLIIIIAAIMAIVIGYNVFVSVFPDIELSFVELYEYASSDSGYTGSGDLNRLNFMTAINNQFLTTISDQLFGMGLGNCDYATGWDFVTSPFSKRYGYLHYSWMSTAFMYIENGWLGLSLYFGFFIYIAVKSLQMAKNPRYNRAHCYIAVMCCAGAILNIFYNISLRIESGYMLYFIIAIPWCTRKYIHNNAKPVLEAE